MSLQLELLPQWEFYLYVALSFGFHFYSFYEVFLVSRGKSLLQAQVLIVFGFCSSQCIDLNSMT